MYKQLLVASTALLFMVSSAHANLLDNGSFEDVDPSIVGIKNLIPLHELDTIGEWDVYDPRLPGGWYTGSGPGIELQYTGTVVPAHSGNIYVELDSHAGDGLANDLPANSAMYQDFVVDTEAEYFVSLWYRPRTNDANDNGINVTLMNSSGSHSIGTLDGISSVITDWTYYSFPLLDTSLTAGTWTIGFEAFGTENTLGGFLDDIAVAAVPEPATMLLFGTGLVGLIGARFRRKKQ